jgi:long-chain acyl-CoA synthetase
VGARFPIKKFGETSWLTYQQAGEMSKAFGRGLLELGMKPQPAGINFETYDGPSTLMIYEDTSKEWTLSAHGAMTQAVCVATSYATLGMDALVASLVETNCTVIMTNKKKVCMCVCGWVVVCHRLV